MKRRYQRFIPCLLCSVLLVFLFAVPVNAAETSGTCGENATWKLVNGILTISGTGRTWDFRNDASWFDYHPCPWEEIKSAIRQVVINEGITYIGASAFYDCDNLVRVSLPESLTGIGAFAFTYCEKLSECELPSRLESIGQENFKRSAIRSVTIPASVTFLDAGIYVCSPELETVYIKGDPDASGFMIGSGVFRGCTALQGIEVEEDHIALSSVDGVLFNKNRDALYAFPAGFGGRVYRIPAGTETISQSAFDVDYGEEDGINIKLLIVPDSVVEIGDLNNLHWLNEVWFEGDAPSGIEYALGLSYMDDRPLTVYYPKNNQTWDEVIAEAAGREEITWVVAKPPSFMMQPTDVTVTAGERASFDVEAIGATAYQWYYRTSSAGNWTKVSAASGKTATYSLTAEARHNGYQYRCEVSNAVGFVCTDTVTLTVNGKPEITTQPTSKTVNAGSNAQFKVTAIGATSYQWYYRTSSTGSWTAVAASSGKTATYSLTAATRHNGYQYRCLVKNASGEVYTNTVTLTVVSKPVITTQPTNVTITAGQTATFKVTATGATSYQWYVSKDKGATWTEILNNSASATYSLATQAKHNGYRYYCKVTNAAGSVYSNTVTLTVSSKPVITTQPSNKTVAAGSTAQFKVVATGATSYQWYYRKTPTGAWTEVAAASGKTATYSLTAEARHNGYQYYCKVTNASGSVNSATVTLNVT